MMNNEQEVFDSAEAAFTRLLDTLKSLESNQEKTLNFSPEVYSKLQSWLMLPTTQDKRRLGQLKRLGKTYNLIFDNYLKSIKIIVYDEQYPGTTDKLKNKIENYFLARNKKISKRLRKFR